VNFIEPEGKGTRDQIQPAEKGAEARKGRENRAAGEHEGKMKKQCNKRTRVEKGFVGRKQRGFVKTGKKAKRPFLRRRARKGRQPQKKGGEEGGRGQK